MRFCVGVIALETSRSTMVTCGLCTIALLVSELASITRSRPMFHSRSVPRFRTHCEKRVNFRYDNYFCCSVRINREQSKSREWQRIPGASMSFKLSDVLRNMRHVAESANGTYTTSVWDTDTVHQHRDR